MRRLEIAEQNVESGQEVAKIFAPALAKRNAAKTHSDYWKSRLERRCYTHNGALVEVNEWSIRIQHLGRRGGFALGTSNKDTAANKAREIYVFLVANGWDAANKKFNPEMVVRKDEPTVGDFIAAVGAKSGLKPKTFRNYANYFRRIVADIFDLGDDSTKFSYRNGGWQLWVSKVEKIKLSAVTPQRVKDWRLDHIKKRDENPLMRDRATRSANSYLRCARSLFSREWIDQLNLRLPDPLPFKDVKIEKNRAPKYVSKVDTKELFAAATTELSNTDKPVYLAFLLGLCVGLRKGELDGLEWKHVRIEKSQIEVAPTIHRSLKTDDSQGTVDIDLALAVELKKFRPASGSGFVIEPKLEPRPTRDLRYYRAQPVFKRLYKWLRCKGVNSDKPLHTLRKEFGSIINLKFGIYAAMTALRHADIGTTSNYYTSNLQRIAMPASEYLNQERECLDREQ